MPLSSTYLHFYFPSTTPPISVTNPYIYPFPPTPSSIAFPPLHYSTPNFLHLSIHSPRPLPIPFLFIFTSLPQNLFPQPIYLLSLSPFLPPLHSLPSLFPFPTP